MAQNKTSQRINFASIKNRLDYPDFLDIQLKSFNDFLQIGSSAEKRTEEGLYSVFNDNFPISDSRNNFVLEFLDYAIDPPRYTIEECIQRGLTFKVPLKAKLKLYCTDPDHEDFETIEQEVFLGSIPYMTPISVSSSSISLASLSPAAKACVNIRLYVLGFISYLLSG